jgi:hypothetical protein
MNFLIPDNMLDKKLTDAEIVNVSNETSNAKIKAIYPHIVVRGKVDKPCYGIQWYDIEKKTMIDGFGSYDLEFVKKWLQEEFEVIDPDIENLIDRLQAENERLNEYIIRCKSGEEHWVKCLLERPNEAIKEFAERLKRELPKWLHPYIDRTEKEMAGDE